MNVLADFHHASLLQSLIMLFEGRLQGKLYRPIGLEWAEQGYWHVFDHPFTRQQFLSTGLGTVEPPVQMYPDGTRPLNIVDKIEDGIYYCQDIDSGYYNKAITLAKFMELPIDIMIASIPQHIQPYKKLCALHPNKPKLIFQIGNAWTVEAGLAPNVMASAIIHGVPPEINFISYHQEFNTDLFHYQEPNNSRDIYSFVNCFNIEQHFTSDWRFFEQIEQIMQDWTFRSYGGQCRDGAAHGSKMLAEKMGEARFIWHAKAGGDGYGHVIHNAAAVGRPLIVKKQYYAGKMGEQLMIDGETCIAIDGLSTEEIRSKIDHYSEPSRYVALCRATYDNFKKMVDFNTEFDAIKEFLKRLR